MLLRCLEATRAFKQWEVSSHQISSHLISSPHAAGDTRRRRRRQARLSAALDLVHLDFVCCLVSWLLPGPSYPAWPALLVVAQKLLGGKVLFSVPRRARLGIGGLVQLGTEA